MKEKSMQINLIRDFLNSKKWQFSKIENNLFSFGINGENGKFQCVIKSIEALKKVLFFSLFGINVPKEKQGKALEFLNALNCKLSSGSFEMDAENGEIRCRTSVSFRYVEGNLESIEEVVMTNILIMDKSQPFIAELITTNSDVGKVINDIENFIQSELKN
jgi:hypothetical protein